MPNITKGDAEAIARKLNADIEAGGKHDLAKIYHGGLKVAQFGIQRGSKKDASHSYIPAQIQVSKKECLDLAKCTLSHDQWVEILTEKGVIVEGDSE